MSDSNNNEKMSHNGNLLSRYIAKENLRHLDVAERMGVRLQTLHYYMKRPSLQSQVMRQASLALKHNFLFDLAVELPVDFVSARETALQKELEDVKRENERLKIEIGVYEKILKK